MNRHDVSMPTLEQRRTLVDVAMGRAPADVVLRGAHVLDPFTREARPADVWVWAHWIAAVLPPGASDAPEASEVVTLDGGLLTPGLIDGHMHLESSLVTPARYAEAVLPRGVTGVVCDPHEVANVAGVEGVRWLLGRAEGVPFDVFATVPSCVPATEMETSGARLDAADVDALLGESGVVGLAELMSFPDVLAGLQEPIAKALAGELGGGTIEGHAPGMTGAALQAYAAVGVQSDHEATRFEEGLEKMRAGLFVFLREGSVAKDVVALAPLLEVAHAERLGFCTDDQLPHDLLRLGGVDHAVRTAVAAGADPLAALVAATWNVARHFGLPRRGAVTPGSMADLVWWGNDVGSLTARRVWKAGLQVAVDGALTPAGREAVLGAGAGPGFAGLQDSVRVPGDLVERLEAALRWREGEDERQAVPVVGVQPASLWTEAREAVPRIVAGRLATDAERDLAMLTCLERHGHHGEVAAAYVQGFGLKRGALASTVGHDHHNLMAVGSDVDAIAVAYRRLAELGGGMVAVDDGRVVAELPLPLAGLLTDAPLVEVASTLDALDQAAEALGVTLPSPFMALSFLGLEVIPSLKLTDQGLVNVDEATFVTLPYGPRRD